MLDKSGADEACFTTLERVIKFSDKFRIIFLTILMV